MPKKDTDADNDQMMDDFEEDSGLEFEQTDELDFATEDDLLLEEGDDDDLLPSVLYKGITRPKTDDDWRQLLLDAGREGIPDYKISDTYKEGALLMHPTFGIGVVTKLISSRKMEIIFESSKKLMAMNVVPPDQTA
jgi:hypothetical protein